MERRILYLDIITDSISYFTEIPQEFIKMHFERMLDSGSKDTALLKSLMNVEFPENEGMVLANYLKSLELENTINYISNSMKLYNNEIVRQATYN